jgi:hypothetical protein
MLPIILELGPFGIRILPFELIEPGFASFRGRKVILEPMTITA